MQNNCQLQVVKKNTVPYIRIPTDILAESEQLWCLCVRLMYQKYVENTSY